MDNSAALVIAPSAMPSLTMTQAKARRDEMLGFVQSIMVKGSDYGEIPGTNKPTLLKPGAEKLATFFGLRPTFSEVRVIEDWTGKDYGGQPFFYYWFRCHLLKDDVVIAEGDGSCNSHESKYRYRQGERKCPQCGKATIIKGKAEYGGGWLCYAKKGGCGAKFIDGDPSIEAQQVGRIENPDIADQVNTLLKMAQKRALVAAVLIGVNASEFFTQDVEDLPGDYLEGEYTVRSADAPQPTSAARPANGNGAPKPANGNVTPLKQAIIKTPKFPQHAQTLADEFPAYRGNTGGADMGHILASMVKLGYPELTDANIADAFAALRQHAQEQQSPAESAA